MVDENANNLLKQITPPDKDTLSEKDFTEFREIVFKRSKLGETIASLELQKMDAIRQLENLREAEKRFSDRIKKRMGVDDIQIDPSTGKVHNLKNLGPVR